VTLDVPSHWGTSGATCAEIAFVNVGGYGNHTWIDNVMVGEVVGLENIELYNTSLIIYPNPSTGVFTVLSTTQYIMHEEYEIFDALGRMVTSGRCEKMFNIDLNNMPRGIYFLNVPGTRVERLVIQ
jgi:hypothetical protein